MGALAFHGHYTGVTTANYPIHPPPEIFTTVQCWSHHASDILADKSSCRARAHCQGCQSISHPCIPHRPGPFLECSCVYILHCTDGRQPGDTVLSAALLACGQGTPACVQVHGTKRRASTHKIAEYNSVCPPSQNVLPFWSQEYRKLRRTFQEINILLERVHLGNIGHRARL